MTRLFPLTLTSACCPHIGRFKKRRCFPSLFPYWHLSTLHWCIHTCGIFSRRSKKLHFFFFFFFFFTSVNTLANSHISAIDFVCASSTEKHQINQVFLAGCEKNTASVNRPYLWKNHAVPLNAKRLHNVQRPARCCHGCCCRRRSLSPRQCGIDVDKRTCFRVSWLLKAESDDRARAIGRRWQWCQSEQFVAVIIPVRSRATNKNVAHLDKRVTMARDRRPGRGPPGRCNNTPRSLKHTPRADKPRRLLS